MYLHEEKPNAKERLVEMTHLTTPDNIKETVLNSIADYEGHPRVLICAIAFGMGVDAKGVRTNIIWNRMYKKVPVAAEMEEVRKVYRSILRSNNRHQCKGHKRLCFN